MKQEGGFLWLISALIRLRRADCLIKTATSLQVATGVCLGIIRAIKTLTGISLGVPNRLEH